MATLRRSTAAGPLRRIASGRINVYTASPGRVGLFEHFVKTID
jgi:hypothetical protein